MSFAKIHTRGLLGLHAPLIEVEVHVSQGLPSLTIVGLPEAAVRESKDRVRSAIINSGFLFPTKRLTINLAPADLPKDGSRLDLPIALGILIASGQLPEHVTDDFEFIGVYNQCIIPLYKQFYANTIQLLKSNNFSLMYEELKKWIYDDEDYEKSITVLGNYIIVLNVKAYLHSYKMRLKTIVKRMINV